MIAGILRMARLLAAQQPMVGQLDFARKYHSYSPAGAVPLPEGYTQKTVSGFEAYAKQASKKHRPQTLVGRWAAV